MKKRLISILVILVMLSVMIPIPCVSAAPADVWLGGVDRSWYSASGTSFTISSAAQLAGLAQIVNDGTDNFNGNTISLSTDIDLDSIQWTPIGLNISYAFQGRFEGNGHKISNLAIGTSLTPTTMQNVGLFGYGGATGVTVTIQDLGVENVSIVAKYSANFSKIGGLCGYYNGIVQDCYATGTIDGRSDNSYIGGLIGQINPATVSNCYADVDILGMGSTSTDPANTTLYTQAGGLIGRSSNSGAPSITNCFATGNINCSGSARVGGLVGYFGSPGANGCSITNSYATGSTYAPAGTYTAVGGFVGFLVSGNIYTSYWNSSSGTAAGIGLNQGVSTSVTGMLPSQMTTAAFIATLNSNSGSTVWKADSENKNSGYPLLDGVGAGIVSNQAPTAQSVHIDGTVQLYQELTGDYIYSDADGDLEGITHLQWYRADDVSGTNRKPISGATTIKYTLQAADIGKRIQFEVSPVATTGTLAGTAVSSSYTAAVEKADSTVTNVEAPVLSSKTDTSATLASVAGYEYTVVANGAAASSGTWQDSPILTGLTSSTAYDIYQRVKETSVYKPSAVSAKLDVTTDPAVLTGTASISGTTSYGQTLTAALGSTNNTGTLSYQWIRGSEDIAGADDPTYVLVSDDIGSQIRVRISSSVETGTVTSGTTATISKAASDPAAGIAPVMSARTDTSINLVSVTGYEYIIVSNGASVSAGIWQNSPVFIGLISNTPYDCYQRVKETSTSLASAVSSKLDVSTNPAALTGTAAIAGSAVYGETLTASLESTNNTGTLSYQWIRGSEDISGETDSTYELTAADIGTQIRVRITSDIETGIVTSAPTTTVTKAACNPATGITPVLSSKTDTSVTLVGVIGYEYKAVTNGASGTTGTWQDSNTITGLTSSTAYDFYQRVKETPTAFSSAISAKLDVTTAPAVLSGTASISGDTICGETLSAALGTSNNTGTLSYQWVRGSDDISGATDPTYTLVSADIGNTIRVRIASSVETGAVTSNPTATVSKAASIPATGITPVLSSKTDTSVTLVTVPGYEYKVVSNGALNTTGTWQDSPAFTLLTSSTPYDFYQRVKETATTAASAVSAKLDVSTNPAVLTGTASISGDTFCGAMLTAALSSSNNTGILSYQWKRGISDITGASDSTYTLVAADVGAQISVVITSSIETGSVTSDPTATIVKASSDPAAGIAPVLLSRTDVSITLTNVPGYEYMIVNNGAASSSGTWQDSPLFAGLTANTPYDFYQRIKETPTNYASSISPKLDGMTEPAALTGTASISGTPIYDEVLTASLSTTNNTGTLSYQWVRGTDDIPGANDQNYTLAAADIGSQIRVRITSDVESGSVLSDPTAIVEKANCLTATGIAPVLSSKTDTSVTLVNVDGYEYIAVANGTSILTGTWQDSEKFTGLTSYTEYDFYQRVKETSTHKASGVSSKLDVKTNPSVLTGTASITGTPTFGETLTAALSATNNSGTLSYQWVRGSDDISGATDPSYTLTAADVGTQLRVRIASSIETGTITSDLTDSVDKADAESPVAPELYSKDRTTVLLRLVNGYEYLAVADGADISTGTWQDSRIFTGLTPNTPYDFYQRMKETSTHKVSAVSIKLDVTTSPNELTGTAEITGTALLGETLTGTLKTSNNTGTLFFQWVRGSENIPGADDPAYTLTVADIGYSIRLKITSSVETGMITSNATSAVQKLNCVTVTGIAPVLLSRKDTSITLVAVPGYEYMIVPDGTTLDAIVWQDSPIFTGLSPNTAYDCYQRVKETSTHKASAVSPKFDAVTDVPSATPTPVPTLTPTPTRTPTPSTKPTAAPTTAPTDAANNTTAQTTLSPSETTAAESANTSETAASEEETKPGETALMSEAALQSDTVQKPDSGVAGSRDSNNGFGWVLPTVLGGLFATGLILFFLVFKKRHKSDGSHRG